VEFLKDWFEVCKSSEKVDSLLFSDDTNLLLPDKDLSTLESVVNLALKVCDRVIANKLTLNFIIFHLYHKEADYYLVTLKTFDKDTSSFLCLERKEYVKYLRVFIDSNLTWKYHIGFIASKIRKSIGIMARLGHYVPISTLLTIY